jgi:hypothetical protein
LAGGVQATGTASLKVVGSPTVVGAGTGYVVGDTVTAGNGVFLTVATLSGSGIATVTLANGGSLTSGSVPTNPVAQVTTTGSGTGATFTLAWGLGPVTITQQGNGYGSATATFGSGAGSGTVAVVVAPWSNFASAINNGASALRGPSQLVVASAGSSVTAPTNGQTATMSGGTDGASAISSAQMMGVDAFPRTGIYAFRNSGISDLVIADFSDTTQESTLITFGQSEGILVHSSGPSGETVATGATTEATNGSNGLFFKRYLGDWCYWPDNQNGVQRVITPSTFGAALMSTLQPQQSGLNKPIPNIQATQRGKTGIPYGSDELAQAEAAGIEIICNPIPAGPGFGMRLGITNSSNGTANTDNWPRLTSFLARSLAGVGALGTLIGQTITAQFFANGYAMIDAFLAPMKSTENGAQIIQNYDIIFGPGNNPQSQTALGIVIAQVNIQYLGIARIFLVNMQGGATVVIPTNANIAAAAALVS